MSCLGPLGQPFKAVAAPMQAWMVAGGVGLAPFATLAETLAASKTPTTLFYGARTGDELFYLEFFERLGVTLVLATEDGGRGVKGRVTLPLEQALKTVGAGGAMVYACGPEPMLEAVAKLAARYQPAVAGVGRARHGLRPGRVLQLRRAGQARPRRSQSRPLVHQRPGVRRRGTGVGRMTPDLSVAIGSLTLPNPLIAASGCFGYGVEYEHVVDLSLLGGIVSKGLFMKERQGHPPPRIVETPAGMINAIGLQGIGVHRFVKEKLPVLRERGARTFVNVCGTTLEEYVEVCKVLSQAEGVAAIELNISCPNIKEGGIQFGCSLNGTYDVVSAVRKATHLPVIPKLTPNVTDVASFARASEEAGADAVSLVNTFLAMAIDVETRRPTISNVMGGLSGPAIRPIAVRMVWECYQLVKIPIIGMGGITNARDAIEFMLAGATAVQIGTQNFVDPFVWTKVLDGLKDYMARHNVARITRSDRRLRSDTRVVGTNL